MYWDYNADARGYNGMIRQLRAWLDTGCTDDAATHWEILG